MSIVFASVAAFIAIVASMWFTEGLNQTARWSLRGALFALIAVVWVRVLRRRISELVDAPLQSVIASAESIAAGDTTKRVDSGSTLEFDALSVSINRMTEQLLEADKMRMRVEKLATMGRLAAGISHEIGNPLAALANYVHVARMRSSASQSIEEPLDAMEREIGRIDRIVRSLLDYSRPRRLTPKPIVIDEVIKDVLVFLKDQGVLRRVDVRSELDAPRAAVYGEKHYIEQVFVNLILNAVDAADKGGVIVVSSRSVPTDQIGLTAPARRSDTTDEHWAHRPSSRALAWLSKRDRPDAVLQLVVADSGTGVAREDEERIFEPFFTTKVPGKGTGLGLAIVANTIENLGGTIWVQRAREGGAAFVILLPLHSVLAGVAAIRKQNGANP